MYRLQSTKWWMLSANRKCAMQYAYRTFFLTGSRSHFPNLYLFCSVILWEPFPHLILAKDPDLFGWIRGAERPGSSPLYQDYGLYILYGCNLFYCTFKYCFPIPQLSSYSLTTVLRCFYALRITQLGGEGRAVWREGQLFTITRILDLK